METFLERLLGVDPQVREAYAKITKDVRPYGRMDITAGAERPEDWLSRPPHGDRTTFHEALHRLLRHLEKFSADDALESPWPIYRRWAETLDGLAAEIEASRGTPEFFNPIDPTNILVDRLERASSEEDRRAIEEAMFRFATAPRVFRDLAQDLREIGGDPANRDRSFRPIRETELYILDLVEMATGHLHYRDVAVILVAAEVLNGQTARPDPFSYEAIFFRRRALEQQRRRARTTERIPK